MIDRGMVVEAITGMGKAGDVIGIVTKDCCGGSVKKGMVVLFDKPPSEVGRTVFCVDYAVRQSQAGKHYVKCFEWVPEGKLEEYLAERSRRALAEAGEKVAGALPERYRGAVRELLEKGSLPGGLRLVVFVDGSVPLTDPSQRVDVAVLDLEDGRVYATRDIYYGSPTIIAPPDVAVIGWEHEAVPSIPGVRLATVFGRRYAVVTDGRLAAALKRLESLRDRLPPDLYEKVASRALALLQAKFQARQEAEEPRRRAVEVGAGAG